ncbi:MAG: hypothetical protein MUC88_00390 [Planctomycetes bacterium]|nr:hypothetical protein [Planctomycetota bacterium]
MTEADLCQQFIDACSGWTAYPETAGWDILMVRGQVQVGVQSKLQADQWGMIQAMPDMGTYLSVRRRNALARGPHYRLVLVGGWPGRTENARRGNRAHFCLVAQHLRLLVARPPENEYQTWLGGVHPPLNLATTYGWNGARPAPIWWRWYRWQTRRPETLPMVVPQVPAGVPSPERVTPWSVAAVLLERRCLELGQVTVADARAVRDQANGRWNPSTMLSRYFEHAPPPKGRWVFHSRWPRPSARHPGTARSLEVGC